MMRLAQTRRSVGRRKNWCIASCAIYVYVSGKPNWDQSQSERTILDILLPFFFSSLFYSIFSDRLLQICAAHSLHLNILYVLHDCSYADIIPSNAWLFDSSSTSSGMVWIARANLYLIWVSTAVSNDRAPISEI